MLLEQKEQYVDCLVELWHKVFGDEEEYIRLFFKEAYYDSECFVKLVDGKVVSAFYLLRCKIRFSDKTYEGRYLYAAATLPEYRGKGIMSELIGEAVAYCKEVNLDYIALVPASESLYGYYGRFGFVEAMYKYRFTLNNDFVTLRAYRETEGADEFYKVRSSVDGVLFYGKKGSDYAFECLRFSGDKIISVSDDSFYIDGEELFIGGDDASAVNFLSSLGGERVVYSNKPLRNAEKIRNGMLYCFDDELTDKGIYMNIALD